MRRIAFFATNEWVPWGGSEFCWAAAADTFARRGVEVSVSVKRWDKPVKEVESLRSAGCKIFYRRPFSVLSRLARKFLPLPQYPHQHVRSVGTEQDLAVISHSSYWEALPWIEAVRASGTPYAIIVQGASETLWPVDDTAEKLALGFENARRPYFVSQANLDLFRRQLGTELQRGRVIRNPFTVRYDVGLTWPQQAVDKLSLACVARLDVIQKAQDLLIDVLSLPHWRNRNVQVVLAGNGPNERSLRRLAEMRKLTSIVFAGFVNDMEHLWSQHHALVLPSRFEGMPLALVEAMLCGRAAIVTDVAGHRELVRDGVNGFLAKAPTVELLDEAMNRAWDNRGRLQEMGERAATDVRQWVSADPVEDFVRDLTSVADGSKPDGGSP